MRCLKAMRDNILLLFIKIIIKNKQEAIFLNAVSFNIKLGLLVKKNQPRLTVSINWLLI